MSGIEERGSKQVLMVGVWRVEPYANTLIKGDRHIRLEPKAMQVLLYLVTKAGIVLPREELLEALWPGVVVEENALRRTISHLRKAFGDDPQNPTYIATYPRMGYRLIAPVRRVAVQPEEGKGRWWSGRALLQRQRWVGGAL